jgi:CheY-like chemotaxis protein
LRRERFEGLVGHEVSPARDGPASLAAAAASPLDLVLLDMGLSGMDDYAVAVRLRAAGHAGTAQDRSRGQ